MTLHSLKPLFEREPRSFVMTSDRETLPQQEIYRSSFCKSECESLPLFAFLVLRFS